MTLEPLDRHDGWRLKFERGSGPEPGTVLLPETLASRYHFAGVQGAESRREGSMVSVTPSAAAWEATWKI
jgi:hypothetical protein